MKTAIILPGGGVKCAYTAGALIALGKKLGITTPDIAVASSGSVGPLMYYLTNQYDEGERAWIRFIPSKEFIRYFPYPRIDVDYLVDKVMKEYLPLDTDKLATATTRYFIPVTDEDTGITQFISNETWFDPFEVMRAAKAIPMFYHRHIFLGAHHYMDGGIGDGPQALVDKAIAEGATNILVISNTAVAKPREYKSFYKAYAYWQRKPLETTLLRFTDRVENITFPPGVKGLNISPTEPLPVGLMTRNKRCVAEAFHMGYDDLLARSQEIIELFKP